jgi:hypothetical protein
MSEHWTEDDGFKEFRKSLDMQLNAEVENLIAVAGDSKDPMVTRCWAAINVMRRMIIDLEAERDKRD